MMIALHKNARTTPAQTWPPLKIHKPLIYIVKPAIFW